MATILNLITNLEPDGAQTVLIDVLRRLRSGRHTLFLGSLTGKISDEKGAGSGVRIIDFSRGGAFDPLVVGRVVRTIRREHVGIVHTHLVHAGIVGKIAAGLTGTPAITTRHYASEAKEKTPVYRLENVLTGRCARVIAVSNAVARYIREKQFASAEKIVVIPNGVDTSMFLPDPHTRDPIGGLEALRAGARTGARAAADPLIIGCVGRCAPQKGQTVLISAFVGVARTDTILEIVGDGPLRQQLEAQAIRAGVADRVRFRGEIPHEDLPRVMSHWDLFAMPSLWEGFGLAAAEAMAMELPVIASRVEGLAELIEDGVTGVLVPPGSPEELAAAILSLLDDEGRRRALGRGARARIERDHSIERTASRIGAIYDSIAG
jgi:glycosyltransferase involved in cell wall biosynthesis